MAQKRYQNYDRNRHAEQQKQDGTHNRASLIGLEKVADIFGNGPLPAIWNRRRFGKNSGELEIRRPLPLNQYDMIPLPATDGRGQARAKRSNQ